MFSDYGCFPARFDQIHTTEEEKLHSEVMKSSIESCVYIQISSYERKI